MNPQQFAGLGAFRPKEYVPGQRVVLERNPFYWKTDRAGNRLPYLNEVTFTFVASEMRRSSAFSPAKRTC